jgi:hypothetical protein
MVKSDSWKGAVLVVEGGIRSMQAQKKNKMQDTQNKKSAAYQQRQILSNWQ